VENKGGKKTKAIVNGNKPMELGKKVINLTLKATPLP